MRKANVSDPDECPVPASQSAYSVALMDPGDDILATTLLLDATLECGASHAAELIEGAPVTILWPVSEREARMMKAALEAFGATVEIGPV